MKAGKSTLKIGRCIIAEKPKRSGADWKPSPALMRLREVEKVIKARHGAIVPETDDGDLYIRAAAFSCTGQDVRQWCARWALWASPELIAQIAAASAKKRHMMSANGVAGLLLVTMEERTRLGLNTIGACDMSLAERKALMKQRKLERDRVLVETKRRAAGKQSRNSYLAEHSASRDKPWLPAGMSRAKWYRLGLNKTGLSRVEGTSLTSDTVVSPLLAEGVAQQTFPPVPPTPVAIFIDGADGRQQMSTPTQDRVSKHVGHLREAEMVRGPGNIPRRGAKGRGPVGVTTQLSEKQHEGRTDRLVRLACCASVGASSRGSHHPLSRQPTAAHDPAHGTRARSGAGTRRRRALA